MGNARCRGIVYKITCDRTGKSYIGVTVQGLNIRWCKHVSSAIHENDRCTLLNNAIRKYGKEAFSVCEIATVLDDRDLFDLEIAVIKQENTLSPNGYNLSHGGRGISKHSESFPKAH